MGILSDIAALNARHAPTAANNAGPVDPLAAQRDKPSAFSQSLRSGYEDAKGQIHQVIGQGAEQLGYNDYAAEQRAKAGVNTAAGEALMEGIPQSYKDVDSLRSGWDYATGMIGKTIPALAAGGAAAYLAPEGLGIAGMVAATAPLMAGSQFAAQQADPVQAAQPVTQRSITGALAGTAQAGVMAVVPGMVGTKLFGRAAEGAVAKEALPFGKAAMEQVPEAVLGNAAAGAASAKIGQVAAGSLNENRSTEHDNDEMIEGAVGGGIVGSMMAPLGIAGAMRGKKAGAPKEPSGITEAGTEVPPGRTGTEMPPPPPPPPPPPGAAGGAARTGERTSPPPTMDEQVAGLGEPLQGAGPTTGREHADRNIDPATETVESMQARDKQGDIDAAEKAVNRMGEMAEAGKTNPFAAAVHAEMSKYDPTTTDGQYAIGQMATEHKLAERARAKVKAGNEAVTPKETADDGTAHSDDYSGANKTLSAMLDRFGSDDAAAGKESKPSEPMDTPEYSYLDAEHKTLATDMVRRIIQTGEDGGIVPAETMRATADMLGKNAVTRLKEIYEAMGDTENPAKVENFYKTLNEFARRTDGDNALHKVVQESLPPGMLKKGSPEYVSPADIRDFIDRKKSVDDQLTRSPHGPEKNAFTQRAIDQKMTELFGDKAAAVNEAFAKHYQDEAKLTPPDVVESAKQKSSPGKTSDDVTEETTMPKGEFNEDAGGVMDAGQEEVHYYGRKPDVKSASPFVRNNIAHTELAPHSDELLGKTPGVRETMSRDEWTAHEKDRKDRLVKAEAARPENDRIARAQAEHPDADVHWMSAREYAEKTGMSESDLHKFTGGKVVKGGIKGGTYAEGRPDDFGIAVARIRHDEHTLSDADLDAMRVGKHTKEIDPLTNETVEVHSKANKALQEAYENGPSSIAVGEHVFDATRIASYMSRTDGKGKGMAYGAADSEYGAQYRTARAFSEGIAALSVKLGRKIDPEDSTIVQRATADRPAQTWGQLKQVLKDGGMNEKARSEVAPLREQRDALFANREAAREKVQNANLDADRAELLAKMNESDAAFDKPIADMNEKIAQARTKHGLDTESQALERQKVVAERGYEAAMARWEKTGNGDIRVRDKINKDMKATIDKIDDKLKSLTDRGYVEPRRPITEFEDSKAKDGMREIDGNQSSITRAVAEHGERLADVSAKMRAKAGEFTEAAKASDAKPITPEGRWAALHDYVGKLADSAKAGSKALGHDLMALIDNRGIMTKVHQAMLDKIIDEDTGKVRPVKEVIGIVKDLIEKYAANKRWSEEGEHSWQNVAAKGGAQHEAILRKITEAEDPKSLHTNLLELLADKNPNEHKTAVIEAMNKKIGDLLADKPDDAYGLMLKSKGEANPNSVAELARNDALTARLVKGGLDAKRAIDRMKVSTDLGALKSSREHLLGSDEGSLHIDNAIEVMGKRIGELEEGFKLFDNDTPKRALGENTYAKLKDPDPLAPAGDALGKRIGATDSTNPYFGKDREKAEDANKFIGRGSDASSTEKYRIAAGDLANTGKYEAGDRVFVSVEGKRVMRKPFDEAEVQKALDAGATIIADKIGARERDYNVGERELAEYLKKNGYSETKPGEWTPKGESVKTLLEGAKRETRLMGRTEDPIAQDILSLKGDKIDQLERLLAEKGVRPTKVLDAGTGSIVLDAGDKVVRLGTGPRAEIPNIPGVIQPIHSGEFGQLRYEVMPKADTKGITDADVVKVAAQLKAQGYKFSDAGTDNVGRVDGKPVVIDPGAIERIEGADTAFSKEKTDQTKSTTTDEQQAVVDHLNKVTGGDADVNAAAKMLYAGSFKEGGKDAQGMDFKPAINVSVHAMNPMSTAFHESMHWFIDHLTKNGHPEVVAALMKAADSAYVRNFLRNKFKNEPEALKQVEGSVMERMAYMYQFHANGELQLGSRAKTIIDHISDFIAKVMKVWTNDERAIHVMDYFNSGKYAEAAIGPGKIGGVDFAAKAMMETGRNRTLDRLWDNVKPLRELSVAMAGVGSARIRDMNIPALTKLADMVHLHGTKEGKDPGYLAAQGVEMRARRMDLVNKLMNAEGKFPGFEAINEAMASIQLGTTPRSAEQVRITEVIKKTLADTYTYLNDAGVAFGHMDPARYFPRQWDAGTIAGKQDEFRAMIQKYIDSGQYKGTADELMKRLMKDEGNEIEGADAQARPGDQHIKVRDLKFISEADAKPFLEKDAMRVLTSYIGQATRRAEWARRFEVFDDIEMRKTNPVDRISTGQKLRDAAVKQGATPDQMAVLEKYLKGVTGQLGSDVSPTMRKWNGWAMVYQNVRVLPLGFFSAMADPMGIAVRGGTMGDVFNNFKRGIMEIPRGFMKDPKADKGYQLAEDMGVIDSAVLQHVLGASYGLNSVGNKTRLINETLFKYNLMEQMNTSQRVGATEAAVRFLMRHGKGDYSAHSMRYLGELGIKPADIKMVGRGDDARLATRIEDFQQLGMNDEAALAAHMKMRQAVNRWVDSAILRPNQSNKSIWMNDPMFATIAHMKQFSYAMQDVILKRVVHEAKHGNYQPAVSLAGYIPTMLAADMVKGMIQSGSTSQPDWKKDWGPGEYLGYAAQRGGLAGVGQFGIDAVKELHHGGSGIGALGGPTVSQLTQIISTLGGQRALSGTVIDAMPANALWSGWGNQRGDSGRRHRNHGGHRGDSTESYTPTAPTNDSE